jgi:hypothetical protein
MIHNHSSLNINLCLDKPKESASNNDTIIDNVHHSPTTSSSKSSSVNAETSADMDTDEFHKLDIRVARILAAHKHAEADTLYVEQGK